MNDQIKNIKINLLLLIRRLEEFIYDDLDDEIEVKIKAMNEKIYELADVIETIELLKE